MDTTTSLSTKRFSAVFRCGVIIALILHHHPTVSALSNNYNVNYKQINVPTSRLQPCRPSSTTALHSKSFHGDDRNSPESVWPIRQSTISRRDGIQRLILQSTATLLTASTILLPTQPATAYTPDSDPLRESLYLMSRVQEATVQQERFVQRATQQEVLKNKMKLTLRLVEKNYRLLDQITYASEFITPSDRVVEATEAGFEAAEALQNAIDYVGSDLKKGNFEEGQKEYLSSNLRECRERMFDFLEYMPREKVEGARRRVEEENVANRDEFDGDDDAGVYNPVILPWKNR